MIQTLTPNPPQPPSTKQAILVHLRKQGQATAQNLATQLQISPQAIRRHLRDLEQEELIQHETVQTGVGRPQHVYQLSPSGQDQFPDSSDEFALDLLSTLAETVGQDQLRSILRKQWERKAQDYRTWIGDGSLSERVAKLAELRQAEGFMAEYYPVDEGSSSNPEYILVEHNCAISSIAHSFPTMICGHELELFAIALPDCVVERIHWVVEGQAHCGYRISPR